MKSSVKPSSMQAGIFGRPAAGGERGRYVRAANKCIHTQMHVRVHAFAFVSVRAPVVRKG